VGSKSLPGHLVWKTSTESVCLCGHCFRNLRIRPFSFGFLNYGSLIYVSAVLSLNWEGKKSRNRIYCPLIGIWQHFSLITLSLNKFKMDI
jgi:hypothetical protein